MVQKAVTVSEAAGAHRGRQHANWCQIAGCRRLIKSQFQNQEQCVRAVMCVTAETLRYFYRVILCAGPAFKFAHDACAYIQNNQITSMHANVSDVNTHSYVYSSQQDALSPPSFLPRWQVRNQRRFRCARAANSLGCSLLNFLCICRRIGRSSSNRSTATVIAIVACTYWLILFNFGFGFHQ